MLPVRMKVVGKVQVMKKIVYIYDGEGGKTISCNLLQSSLERCLCPKSHIVARISPAQIKKGDWQHDCAAIILGGGYDLGFIKALGPSGVKMLRDFVMNGGTYIGFCAGGYFGCDFIEFDKSGKLEVCGERHLKFYPGKCIGPVVPGFQYDTEKGLDAMPIKCRFPQSAGSGGDFLFQAYVNGGGYFAPYPASCMVQYPHIQHVETLASYVSLPGQPAAMVRCQVGGNGGIAVLTGPHPEFSAYELDPSDADLQKHLTALRRHDIMREKCLTLLLQSANLKVKEKLQAAVIASRL